MSLLVIHQWNYHSHIYLTLSIWTIFIVTSANARQSCANPSKIRHSIHSRLRWPKTDCVSKLHEFHMPNHMNLEAILPGNMHSTKIWNTRETQTELNYFDTLIPCFVHGVPFLALSSKLPGILSHMPTYTFHWTHIFRWCSSSTEHCRVIQVRINEK